MPRPRVGYGRPGTTVIPGQWAENLRPVAEGTMTASIKLRHPGTIKGAFDDATGTYTQTPNAAYATTRCRVQAMANQADTTQTGEDTVTVAGYLLTVPATTPEVRVGDVGVVTGSGDPQLDGHTIRVGDVVRGSLLVERDLFCTITTT